MNLFCRVPFEVSVMKELPSEQLDELKSVIFTYVVLAPLLAALFNPTINSLTQLNCILLNKINATIRKISFIGGCHES